MDKENVIKALQELRKQEKRKFVQTAELIINLRNFDVFVVADKVYGFGKLRDL